MLLSMPKLKGGKCFASQVEKQQHINATQHEGLCTANLAAMFFYFLFFPVLGRLQDGCLHWNATGFELFQMKYFSLNTSATPSPPNPQCHKHLHP